MNTCAGCQDRQVGCHATCEKYLTRKKEIEDKKKAQTKVQDVERAIRGVLRQKNIRKK